MQSTSSSMQADSTTTSTTKRQDHMKKRAFKKSQLQTKSKKRKVANNSGSGLVKKKKKDTKEKDSTSRHDEMEEESGDEQWMDLTRDLKPIGCFIDDRAAMLDEMFAVTKGKLYKNMLPDLLANIPKEDLKMLFLAELEGMSKKRIGYILAGEDMVESSDTDDDDDDNDIIETSSNQCEPVKSNVAADSTSVVVLQECDNTQIPSESMVEGEDPGVSSTTTGLTTTATSEAVLNNDQLEILELELRARAIRSLMHAMNGKETSVSLPTTPATIIVATSATSATSATTATTVASSGSTVATSDTTFATSATNATTTQVSKEPESTEQSDGDKTTLRYDDEDFLELEPGELL